MSMYNFKIGLLSSLREKGYSAVIIAPYDKYLEYLKQEFEYCDIKIDNQMGESY